MFGYIVTNKKEMKPEDVKRYQAFYCGLCRALKERYGKAGQVTLNYDMTFLTILLNALYEPDYRQERHACIMHPAKMHDMYMNEITDYAADMGILLSYYNLMDDWKDDRNAKSKALAKLLEQHYGDLKNQYPRQVRAVEDYVRELTVCETEGDFSLDRAAGLTGTMMAEIMLWKEDVWEKDLRRIGFFLGKFIYLMDAYEDVIADCKSGSYNPWKQYYHNESGEKFNRRVEDILNLMMAEAAKAFEKLPIIQDADILRNILYAGSWNKFEQMKRKREKKE
ncbi:MAG: DUF5685 family protein [bacterium]|nr:DUF5685 family protein [bacterium]